jgi:hypothetical protein
LTSTYKNDLKQISKKISTLSESEKKLKNPLNQENTKKYIIQKPDYINYNILKNIQFSSVLVS